MKNWVLLILLGVKLFDNEYMSIFVMGMHLYIWMVLYHCDVEFAQCDVLGST
jgi:hypothetical protein